MPKPNISSLASNSRTRAENFGLTEHFTEADVQALLESCDYCCLACGRSSDKVMLSVDHIVPLTRGGKNTIDNLQILCRRCNSKKFDKIIDYRNTPPVFIADSEQDAPAKKKFIQLILRLPPHLRVALEEEAERERRSLNAQVVVLLQAAKDAQDPPVH